MAIERTLPLRVVELRVEDLVTGVDFVGALKKIIGAPDWHGDSVDAFLDSMIHHGDINDLKPPYVIRIVGADRAGTEARDAIREFAQFIDKHGASDRGGDLEVTILVEESN